MPEESLLTPELLALVGQEGEAVRAVVDEALVRRVRDLSEVKSTPFPREGDPLGALVLVVLEAGVPDVFFSIAVLPQKLVANHEWRLYRPVRYGEELTMRRRAERLSERAGGRLGHTLHIRSVVAFRDSAGELVGESVRGLVQYDPRNAGVGESE